MNDIGPVQILVVGFGEAAHFEGRVVAELERLEAAGTVRVLDLLFVHKDAESGDLIALDVQGPDLGAVAGALLGFESEGDGNGSLRAPRSGDRTYGLSKDDLEGVARALEPGVAVAVLLIEHTWARPLKQAIRDAGGVPLGEGFLAADAMADVADDLVAMADAIEKEHAAPTA
jgi:hypothetical protein